MAIDTNVRYLDWTQTEWVHCTMHVANGCINIFQRVFGTWFCVSTNNVIAHFGRAHGASKLPYVVIYTPAATEKHQNIVSLSAYPKTKF